MTAGAGFSKKERLLKSRDFRNVYTNGCKISVGGAAICWLENALGHNRLGFSISSRNFKLAAARNRIRRLFREVYRLKKSELRPGFDMVLVVKRGFDKNSHYTKAEGLFKELVKKAGLV